MVLPYAPRSGQMLVNMVELDHTPWALDPRAFLQRMVARAAEKDLAFDAAFENEFYLALRTEGGYVPVDRSLCFSAIGMESTEPVIQDIIAALTDQGPDRRAVASRARLGSAGAVDPPRPGAPRRRQPDHLPPDGPGGRRSTWSGRLARPQALRRPGGQRRPPPLEHLGRGPPDEPADRRAGRERVELARSLGHRGGARASSGPAGTHHPERQLVPPAAAALLELRLHGLGHREPRGRRPRAEPLLGRSRGIREPRAQGERRERQSLHLARRRDGGSARWHRPTARSGRAGRHRPWQSHGEGAEAAGHPALS